MYYKALGALVVVGAVLYLASAASAQQVIVYQPVTPATDEVPF